MGALVAVVNKNGENATKTALKMLEALQPRNPDAYGLATPTETQIEKTTEALKDNEPESDIVLGYAFTKILKTEKPQPLKLKDATLVFEGRLYPATDDNSLNATAQKLVIRPEQAAANLIREAEGDFTLAIAEPQRIVAGRDPMGTRPLYYGENAAIAVLASQRKALWKIGIRKAVSFPPGHIALMSKDGFTFAPVKTLKRPKPAKTTLEQAAKTVQTFLEESVADRVKDTEDVAVAFSGGLDSSLVAVLAKNAGANVHLIHVSLKGQEETQHAQEVAEELGLPIHTCLYSEREVTEILPKALIAIEEADPVKVAIAVPFFWTARKAVDMGLKVLLAGQGADELFGGYKRYVDTYSKLGKEAAEESIFTDVATNYANNLERDSKICSFHGTELRLPFTSYRLVTYVLSLPLELNMEGGTGSLRKVVLRETARNLKLPSSVVDRPKKAIQYATGVSKVLIRLAKENELPLKQYLRNVWQSAQEPEGKTE